MPYLSRERHNEWQRAYRQRKREGLPVRVRDIADERRKMEMEAYARAAWQAYQQREARR